MILARTWAGPDKVRPTTVITVAIIAALFAVIAYANLRRAAPSKRVRDRGVAARAEALLRQARVAGNPGFAFEAEQILTKALADDSDDYEASRALGAVYLSQHRFRDAIALGNKNRAGRPYDPVNYGVIGDGHLELGDYDEAFEAFDRMMALRPSAAAYARVAYARELQGNLGGAVAAMKLAVDATGADDPEGVAWTHAQIGDLWLQLGRVHDAKIEYAAASRVFPGHPFAVMGYAKALTAEGEIAGALTLLQDLARKAPTADLAARTGDLLERLGRHKAAEKQYALAESAWRVDMPEPKSLARFLADHDRKTDDAVKIAESAAVDRHDIFTEDALAWAYFKAGHLDAARRTIALALRTGTRDRDIRSHAGIIMAAVPRMAAR